MTATLYKVGFPLTPARSGWRSYFTDWLERAGRLDDLVNIYWNSSPPKREIVVVLSDRNTALLMKLALS